MGGKKIPLLLWVVGVALWSLVFVDRCIGDDSDTTMVRELPAVVESSGTAITPVVSPADGGSAAAPMRQRCIDVNRADEKELDALPGIGPAIARRIIDFRNKNGRFATLAELDAVKGIGPVMLSKLDGRVCF